MLLGQSIQFLIDTIPEEDDNNGAAVAGGFVNGFWEKYRKPIMVFMGGLATISALYVFNQIDFDQFTMITTSISSTWAFIPFEVEESLLSIEDHPPPDDMENGGQGEASP